MDKKAVQVQMTGSTLSKIEELTEILHTSNKSEVVRTSVDIAEIVARTIKEGGSITVEKKNGEKMRILLPTI